jgi:hypothetical protein
LSRAYKILQTTDVKLMQPEGWVGGGKECEHCPFAKECTLERIGKPVDPQVTMPQDPALAEEFFKLASAERALATTISGLQREQRDLQQQIKCRLSDLGLRSFDDGDRLRIVWSPVKGRPSWNMPALREAAQALGLDIQQFETVGDPSDRLSITLRKDPVASRDVQEPIAQHTETVT